MVALPMLVLILAVLACRLRRQNWATCLVIAASFWAAYLVLVSESLSLVRGLKPTWIALSWLVALLALLWILWRSGEWREWIRRLQVRRAQLRKPWVFLALALALLSALLFLTAVVSPANTTDSLRYHMPRVLHWAQNASLAHYPTGYRPQLWNPPFAEMAILHLRLLSGSDQFANLVQWASMLGSLVVTAGIARLLGASRLGRAVAVTFAFSLPMGLLQATSTQTDYVTAFWLLSTVYLIILGRERQLNRLEMISLSLAIGLGLLTKATFYIYVLPLVIWYAIHLIRQTGWRHAIVVVVWLAVPAVLINSSHWFRNVSIFGGPFGTANWVEDSSNLGARASGAAPFLSSLLRSLAINFSSPLPQANQAIEQIVAGIESGVGATVSEYSVIWAWNHEDLAGSPIHLILVGVTVLLLFALRPAKKAVWGYALALLISFVLVALAIAYSPHNVRFQLPFFVAWAPLFGVALSPPKLRWPATLSIVLLLLVSLPYVLFNATRPLIGMQPNPKGLEIPCVLGCTSIGSILEVPETDLLFANWREEQQPATAAAEAIADLGCSQIGLRIDSHDFEYTYWWLLESLDSNMRIETLYTFPALEPLKDPTFKPCAIVCTICGDRTEIHGLEQVFSEGRTSVYGGTGYVPEYDG
ncbi:MAG: ArnT family glycosyltransferase [Anaerolineales bacterium]